MTAQTRRQTAEARILQRPTMVVVDRLKLPIPPPSGKVRRDCPELRKGFFHSFGRFTNHFAHHCNCYLNKLARRDCELCRRVAPPPAAALARGSWRRRIVFPRFFGVKGSSGFRCSWRVFVHITYVVARFGSVRWRCSGGPVRRAGVPWAAAWFWRSPVVMATARPPPDKRSRSRRRTELFSSFSRVTLVPFKLLVAAEVCWSYSTSSAIWPFICNKPWSSYAIMPRARGIILRVGIITVVVLWIISSCMSSERIFLERERLNYSPLSMPRPCCDARPSYDSLPGVISENNLGPRAILE